MNTANNNIQNHKLSDNSALHTGQEQTNTPEKSAQMKLPEALPRKTWGQTLHKAITWGGIDWLLNAAFGVTATYITKRTKIGKEVIAPKISGVFKNIAKNFTNNPKIHEESAAWGSDFVSIMVGGFAIIPVLSWFDSKDVKLGFIKWCDEKIYGEKAVNEDPSFAAAYEKSGKEVKTDFWTGMTARMIAIAPLITAVSIPSINRHLKSHIYDPIAAGTKSVAGTLNIKPQGHLLEETQILHNGQEVMQSNWDFLHEKIGFDFGLTVFYAILHKKACQMVGRAKRDNQSGETVTAPCHSVSPSSASAISNIGCDDTQQQKTSYATQEKRAERPARGMDSYAKDVINSKQQDSLAPMAV